MLSRIVERERLFAFKQFMVTIPSDLETAVDENMPFTLTERSTLVALFFFVLLVPGMWSTVNAQANHPTGIYDPPVSPSMPLPSVGYATPIVPVSGVIRVLVVAAAFSDVNNTLSIAQLKKAWTGAVPSYYHEVSFGKLTIQSDFFGWYKLPYPKAHYGKNCKSINDADCSGQDQSYLVANDVVQLAQKEVNFSNYDYYVFIHSGPGQETSADTNDVWSVTYMGTVSIRTNTKTLLKFNIVPEIEDHGTVPDGVWCLEFGHNLGLPDLYNTGSGKSILGRWELMDKGSWNGHPDGSSPAHMIAWDKIQLGFISGSMLATAYPGVNLNFTVDPTEIASTNVHAIKIMLTMAANQSQYYLVEVRTKTGFDSALPSEGVLITYVDETLPIGPVHVIDGHPKLANLDYAVWYVGQTFNDNNHNLALTVKDKVGKSYRITVTSNKPHPSPSPSNETTMNPQCFNILLSAGQNGQLSDVNASSQLNSSWPLRDLESWQVLNRLRITE